jgi:glycosyltransferase involved in cell wall biosynthesis
MTHALAADDGLDAASQAKLRITLPLVSVIIVNYNYQRFLIEAADSVLSQSYPNIELIVVDDASTDDSGSILDAIEKSHPEVKLVRCTQNGGQSVASQKGFEASTGDYVVFLDADDVLLPDFVLTHMFVHLSLRVPVGFTSSDMAQAAGSRLILSTIQHFSDYIRAAKKKPQDLIRRVDENDRRLWPLSAPEVDIFDHIYFVPPDYGKAWMWAPTSGNCFRRDALSLFLNNPVLADLRSCTDAYIVRAVAVLSGSVLIDRALSVYRLHGANVFSKSPNLNGFLNYDRFAPNDNDQKGRRMVIDHLIANADFFARKVHSPYYFLRALWTLNGSWPRLPSRIGGCRSYVGGEVIGHFASLSAVIPRWQLCLFACLLGVAPWTLISAWLKSFSPRET